MVNTQRETMQDMDGMMNDLRVMIEEIMEGGVCCVDWKWDL